MLSTIVFSKDRPLQLQAYIESLLHFSQISENSLYIIYKESKNISYWDLIRLFPKAKWIEEDNFYETLRQVIENSSKYILWGCDDVYYKSLFEPRICIEALETDPSLFGFSLKLGRNIKPHPQLSKKNGYLLWDWTQANIPHVHYPWEIGDWGYPWEISASIYRKEDIVKFLSLNTRADNPNYFEGELASYFKEHKRNVLRRNFACFEDSKCLTLTVNRVQNTHPNRFWGDSKTDINKLYQSFKHNEKIHWIKHQNCNNPIIQVNAEYFELKYVEPCELSFFSPVVSVVIPCYNQGKYLQDAISSIMNQTFQNFEVIVVNDGSNDDTLQAVQQIKLKYPKYIIRLINQQNSGLPTARNSGIIEAKGRYILPLDADDMIAPTMLERCLKLLDENQSISIAYTDRKDFGDSDSIIQAANYNFPLLRYKNQLSYCALYRKEVWQNVRGYRSHMKLGCEDWDFWIAAGLKGYFGKRIPQPLFWYRRREDSMYQNNTSKNLNYIYAQIVLNNKKAYPSKDIVRAHEVILQR